MTGDEFFAALRNVPPEQLADSLRKFGLPEYVVDRILAAAGHEPVARPVDQEAPMVDVSYRGVFFRGYPVQYVTRGVLDALHGDIWAEDGIPEVLHNAVDLAEPGEPADWHFQGYSGNGTRCWIERSGGVRDERGHHGGHWTIYLPEER